MTKMDITIIALEIYFIAILFIGRPYANWRHRVWLNEDGKYDRTELVLFPFSWGMYGSMDIFIAIRDERPVYIFMVSVFWPISIALNILSCFLHWLYEKIDNFLISIGVPVDERLR